MKRNLIVDPLLKFNKVNDALDLPVFIRVNEFTEESLEDFQDDFWDAEATKQPVIPIIIDSYGGQVYALQGMLSIVEQSKVPVATICTSKAMSCGAFLLCWGTDGYRFLDPNATVMIHDMSLGAWGKVEEVKSGAKNGERLNKQIFKRAAKRLGHPQNHFLEMMDSKKHAEWYMGATEAKKHNIANELRIPELNVRIGVEMTFD